MRKYLFYLFCLLSSATYGQCDTATATIASSVTTTSATISATIPGSVTYVQVHYVRVGYTDTIVTFPQSSGVWNLTGLYSSVQYVFYIQTFCSGGAYQFPAGRYYFSTNTPTVVYTPMTANGYNYKRTANDLTFHIPFGDTILNNGLTRPGALVLFTGDSALYAWNGLKWVLAGGGLASLEAEIASKVDSVTLQGDTLLCYWVGGVSNCYTLPMIPTLQQVVDAGNSATRVNLDTLGLQMGSVYASLRASPTLTNDATFYFPDISAYTTEANIPVKINGKIADNTGVVTIGASDIATAGYGLTLSSNEFSVDSTSIPNYRLADSISRSIGILTTTVAAFVDTAVRKDMSDIVKLPDGRWLMVYTKYRLGAGDGNVADINWAISTNGGKSWTEMGRAYSNFSTSIYQPSVKAQPDGDAIMLFNVKTGANTAEIYKGRLASGATMWDAPSSVYNPSAYLVQASGRIFDDYSYSGKWFYPFELSSNGAVDCSSVLSTGKILTSSDYGDTWSLSGVTITSSDSKVEEPGMYRITDSLYFYWRNTTGVVLGAKSTNSGTSFGSQFGYNITAPCSMTTMQYFSDHDLLIAVHNKYVGSPYASASRAVFQIDASVDRGGSFSPVYVFPKYDGYYLHQPTIFRDNGYVVIQYSKIKLLEDSASQMQSIIPITSLLPKGIPYQYGNTFSWTGANYKTYTLDGSALTGNTTQLINPVSGDNTYLSIQKSTLTPRYLPHTDQYGRLITKSISPIIDTTTGAMTLPAGLNLGGITTSNGTLTIPSNSSASFLAARLRSPGNDFAQFNFYTSDGATQIASFGAERVGTNGGGFYIVTKADGGAVAQTHTFRNNGLFIGGATAPTAKLHFAAGTAAANTAPLKFTAGTNLTTPEAGAVEFDGTNYYVTTGSTRHTLPKTLTGSATLDFGSTAAQSSTDLTITVTGAADGDVVSIGVPNASTLTNSSFSAWVSATNTVTIRFNNYSSGSQDPAGGTFKVSVIK